MQLRFSGTVVTCTTRYRIQEPVVAKIVGFDCNWVLTIAVDETSEGSPWQVGERISFLIHSPVQLLLVDAEQAVGQRFAFAIDYVHGGSPVWSRFEATLVPSARS